MKVFLSTIFVLLALVFTMNWIADPLGLRHGDLAEFTSANTEHCAIDLAFIPEAAQRELKFGLLARARAGTIAVGNSRVMTLRRSDFGGDFVNFGISGLGPESLPAFQHELQKYPSLSRILMGLDFRLYSKQNYIALDALLKRTDRLGLKQILINLIFSVRSVRLTTLTLTSTWDLITEYLSLPATRRTLSRWREQGQLWPKTYHLSLPFASRVDSHCLLSSTPVVNDHGAWDARDASRYEKEDLLGLPTRPFFRDFDVQFTAETNKLQQSHWYAGIEEIPDFQLLYLESFLSEMRRRGIEVAGFSSPLPDRVIRGLRTSGLDTIVTHFERRVTTLFLKYGYHYEPMTSATAVGCKDETQFIDPWHPDYECMHRFVTYLKTRTSLIPRL